MTPTKTCCECGSAMFITDGEWICEPFPYGQDDLEPFPIGCGHTETLAMDVVASLDPNQHRMEGF